MEMCLFSEFDLNSNVLEEKPLVQKIMVVGLFLYPNAGIKIAKW